MAGSTSKKLGIFYRLVLSAVFVLVITTGVLAESDSAGPYPGDLGQMIASILIFLCLLLVLKKWAWKPIITQLHNREKDVAESIQKAHDREEKANELLQEYQNQLDSVQTECEKIVTQAKKDSQDIHDDVLNSAREEAKKLLAQARDEIQMARTETLKQMQATTAGIATDLVKKLLDKNLTPEDHEKLVAESLRAIKARSGEQG